MKGLSVENLVVRRGSFVVTVDRLEVPSGQVVALVGKSGSGKSTVLECLGGFLPMERGSIIVDGRTLESQPPEKRRIALVFQRNALFPHLSVGGNVEFGLRVQGMEKKARQTLAREWLGKVGLQGMEDRPISAISEGQAQRVALARALAVGFPLLLLDEPFSALDADSRKSAGELLRNLVDETKVAALFVSHHREDVLQVADRVVMQDSGKLVWSGSVKQWGETSGSPQA